MGKVSLSFAAAIAAAASVGAAQAAPNSPLSVQSYHDLLEPIPNASEKLAAADEDLRHDAAVETIKADWHHHHHHHHHRRWRRHHDI